MRNPFRTQLPLTSYAPVPVQEPDSDTWARHPNTVELDDADYPDTLISPERGAVNNTWNPEELPAYNPATRRELIHTPSQFTEYSSTNPAPGSGGSLDLTTPVDVGSIPATVSLDVLDGPVSGFAMDAHSWSGTRAVLRGPNAGAYGPVVGGPDYANVVSLAEFQEQFASYSNDASSVANVNAI